MMACRLVLCGSSVYDQKKSFWSLEALSERFAWEVAAPMVGGCTVEVVAVDRIVVRSKETPMREFIKIESCSIGSRSTGTGVENNILFPCSNLGE